MDLLTQYYSNVLEHSLLKEIKSEGIEKNFKSGAILMDVGQTIRSMPLLLEGAIKVMRVDEEGHEILLYYLERGDVCSMTMTCCAGNSLSKIKAVVEKDAKVILVSVQLMENWLKKYPSWRKFVFDSYDARFTELLGAIDTLAFKDMKARLITYLGDKSEVMSSKVLSITHTEIANDLNTSRVVISRLIKRLVDDNMVAISRNKITIL